MPAEKTIFENLLEAVPDGLVGVDPAGVIRFVNRQSESLFGYERDDLIGLPMETLVPESLGQLHALHRQEDLADPSVRSLVLDLDLSARKRDGTTFPVKVSLSDASTEGGSLVLATVRDMTSHRTTASNHHSRDQLAAIVEDSDDAIIGKTPDGIVTSWNPAAERIYGYPGEQIIGRPVELLSPQDRTDEMTAVLARIRSGERIPHFETLHVRGDGTVIPVSLAVSPIHDEDGSIVGVSTIARDITTQRQAAETARSMIEASLDPLVTISPAGRITDVNRATVTLTGVPREELIGTAFSDYFTDPEKANEVYQLVFTEGMAVDYPLTIRHRDGTLTDVLYNASVHRGIGGNVIAVFAAARDVTELREALNSTQSMIESSLDSMVSISPEGKITGANEATVKLTGVPREQLIGTAFSDYFTDPEKANEIYQRVFTDGMAVDYPLTLRHRDGNDTDTEVLYNASVYRDSMGKVLGVFAAARDVTKQKQARRELAEQRGKELERLAELERFQRLTIGRELKMIELKKEIEFLRKFAPEQAETEMSAPSSSAVAGATGLRQDGGSDPPDD